RRRRTGPPPAHRAPLPRAAPPPPPPPNPSPREPLPTGRPPEQRRERRQQPPPRRRSLAARARKHDRPHPPTASGQRIRLAAGQISAAVQRDPRPLDTKRRRHLPCDPLELAAHLGTVSPSPAYPSTRRRPARLPPRPRRKLAPHHGCDQEHEQREPILRVPQRQRVQRRQEEEVERQHRGDRHPNRISQHRNDGH